MVDSPGGPVLGVPLPNASTGSDTTELEETVTMEAIPGTLQAQLQQRQVLTGEIQRAMAMSQVNSRVDAIEKVLGGKLGDTVKMLQELAGSQKAQGEKLEAVASASASQPHRRLEARLQTLEAGGGGRPTGATDLEDDAGNRKPTINRPLRGPAGVVVHWSQLTSLQYRQQLFEGFGDGVGRPKVVLCEVPVRCQAGRQARWG